MIVSIFSLTVGVTGLAVVSINMTMPARHSSIEARLVFILFPVNTCLNPYNEDFDGFRASYTFVYFKGSTLYMSVTEGSYKFKTFIKNALTVKG